VSDNHQSIHGKQFKGSAKKLPSPFDRTKKKKIQDPNYPGLWIPSTLLTDHFYDTGLYECEWKLSKYLKTNHPYMGRMAFPEDESRPSRTVTATKIGSSREAIVFSSEILREGDGQYRTATAREAACLMGFPISYQFKGSEGTKWRLVGNAVSPDVSRALARQVKRELYISLEESPLVTSEVKSHRHFGSCFR
jgi:DNA (cytosine-5)-methyltransferase 1